jgi:hypothetical protein
MKTQVELITQFSGHYLTKHLPADWDIMEGCDLMEYIEDHLCEDFETWHPDTVFEHIEAVASEAHALLKEAGA